ncbi:MAG: cytochrome d ubiquinol oxidase subunit II [Deltaproteobacteria bacterium]|nr:cytochrome d ubiquinol oxidase subunit II [Deltaproteobacteria bacterium]
MSWLQITWFMLLGVLLTGFAVMDGFDLGVGFWHLGAKGDRERRTLLNSIGPVWDGNEVWLLTGGGALFAAFAPVYAAVFSGFYIAMMLVLLALIFRAVSLEFRSREESLVWRTTWDYIFSISSTLAALLFGVALGNILHGIPLNENGDYTGTFLALLNPYALLIGLVGLFMMALHGANFIIIKTDGELAEKAVSWAVRAGVLYGVLFVLASIYTITGFEHLMANYYKVPVLWAIPLTAIVSIILSTLYAKKHQGVKAFIFSTLSIVSMMGITGAALFPRLVPASNNPQFTLTAANSSSSELTLLTMLILAAIGVPIVLGYTFWAYKSFSGKVDMDSSSNHY